MICFKKKQPINSLLALSIEPRFKHFSGPNQHQWATGGQRCLGPGLPTHTPHRPSIARVYLGSVGSSTLQFLPSSCHSSRRSPGLAGWAGPPRRPLGTQTPHPDACGEGCPRGSGALWVGGGGGQGRCKSTWGHGREPWAKVQLCHRLPLATRPALPGLLSQLSSNFSGSGNDPREMGVRPPQALPANCRSWCLGKKAFLRYLVKDTDLRKFPGRPPLPDLYLPLPSPTLRKPALHPLLGTLQVLQNPGQLDTCLPPLADSPEFPFHSPGERKTGSKSRAFCVPSKSSSAQPDCCSTLLCSSTHQDYNGGISGTVLSPGKPKPMLAAPPFPPSLVSYRMAPYLASWPSSSNTTISSTQKMAQALAIWPAR